MFTRVSAQKGAAASAAERASGSGPSFLPERLRPAPAPGRSGEPLPAADRRSFESSFQADLSSVRLHRGPEAASRGAAAFTRGEDIHVRPEVLRMGGETGRRVLGHELVHVLQQRAGRVPAGAGGAPVNRDPGLEREAHRQGDRAASGGTAPVPGAAFSPLSQGSVLQMLSDEEFWRIFVLKDDERAAELARLSEEDRQEYFRLAEQYFGDVAEPVSPRRSVKRPAPSFGDQQFWAIMDETDASAQEAMMASLSEEDRIAFAERHAHYFPREEAPATTTSTSSGAITNADPSTPPVPQRSGPEESPSAPLKRPRPQTSEAAAAAPPAAVAPPTAAELYQGKAVLVVSDGNLEFAERLWERARPRSLTVTTYESAHGLLGGRATQDRAMRLRAAGVTLIHGVNIINWNPRGLTPPDVMVYNGPYTGSIETEPNRRLIQGTKETARRLLAPGGLLLISQRLSEREVKFQVRREEQGMRRRYSFELDPTELPYERFRSGGAFGSETEKYPPRGMERVVALGRSEDLAFGSPASTIDEEGPYRFRDPEVARRYSAAWKGHAPAPVPRLPPPPPGRGAPLPVARGMALPPPVPAYGAPPFRAAPPIPLRPAGPPVPLLPASPRGRGVPPPVARGTAPPLGRGVPPGRGLLQSAPPRPAPPVGRGIPSAHPVPAPPQQLPYVSGEWLESLTAEELEDFLRQLP